MRPGPEGIWEFLGKLEKHLPHVASRNPLVSLRDLKEFANALKQDPLGRADEIFLTMATLVYDDEGEEAMADLFRAYFHDMPQDSQTMLALYLAKQALKK
jgi:hypothetical protein